MPFTVVFIVSSSVQSISKAVRATRPHNSPYSTWWKKYAVLVVRSQVASLYHRRQRAVFLEFPSRRDAAEPLC